MSGAGPIRPRLWLIGCGAMAGAMLSRWLTVGLVHAADVAVANRADRALPGNVAQGRALPAGGAPDALILAIKPQQLAEAAAMHRDAIGRAPIVLSVLAGVTAAQVRAVTGAACVVRAMPNLPVAIGQGVVGLYAGPDVSPAQRQWAADLMASLGLVEWVADEGLFDAVTALSGSGPAFAYRFIDALAAGGAALGIPADQAARMAMATLAGAAALAADSADSPAMLADRVASKGGSTRAGLDVLDADEALARLVAATLAAARDRNAELAALAAPAPAG